MYLPTHFSEARPDVLRACVREHPLGLLVTQSRAGGIDANSVPFVLDADGDAPGVLRAHVARANPLWKTARDDADALVVFQGPHGYVSPAWYPSKAEHGKVVPTWNYVMVQARGRLRAIDDRAWLRDFVSRLTDRHEAGRPAPWRDGVAAPCMAIGFVHAIDRRDLHARIGARPGLPETQTGRREDQGVAWRLPALRGSCLTRANPLAPACVP